MRPQRQDGEVLTLYQEHNIMALRQLGYKVVRPWTYARADAVCMVRIVKDQYDCIQVLPGEVDAHARSDKLPEGTRL
jgi:hypothetical protein